MVSGFPATVSAQVANPPAVTIGLAAIEKKFDERRRELGVPGAALAIVYEDKVILAKGFGYRDLNGEKPVRPETLFAIGSATKAFTALTVLMSQDEGKLSLDDPPKKYLPFFKMSDPDADQKMTIRDLLSHSSGLNRTDLAWITGRLNRREIIEVAAQAKPTAKFRETFQYQNIMFLAAGEIVGKVQQMPWEKMVETRIFKPLGMNSSDLSIRQMERKPDRALGYTFNSDTKENQLVPYRNIDAIGPAGSINSSALDMAQWLRFILNGGKVGDKRLVSEAAFAEWTKPQMKIAGGVDYGLGWFLQSWKGLKVVQHGGNIDGFNSMVAMIPEKKLGFVMLTNVSASSLGSEMMPVVWENILGSQTSDTVAGDQKEAGKYRFEAAGFDITIEFKDGRLYAVVPGQPTYTLEKVGERRYRMQGAPEGFFITFRDTELFLEQPHGNYTLPRAKEDMPSAPDAKAVPADLTGLYQNEKAPVKLEIKQEGGKATLNIAGQQPYTLAEIGKDEYSLAPLPAAYKLRVVRDDKGAVRSIIIVQPEGEFSYLPFKSEKPSITLEELNQKAIEAVGGRSNIEKIKTRVVRYDADMQNQGVQVKGVAYQEAPNKAANESELTAVGKVIGKGYDFFDGSQGEELYSFAPVTKYTGKRLEDARISADMSLVLNWKAAIPKAAITGTADVKGEKAYVVVFEPEKGTKFTEYYSAKSFLLLKREGTTPIASADIELPYWITFEDYRDVDGMKLPFKTTTYNQSNGITITTITDVKQNVPIDAKVFSARKLPRLK